MLKVYTGPMFSGKSKSLIDEYNSIEDKDKIVGFKPTIDTRDGEYIKSRAKIEKIPCLLIDAFEEIPELSKEMDTIFIDEAQFLQGDATVLHNLNLQGKNIIVGGLNQTAEQRVFGEMPILLSLADEIVKLFSECKECGGKASYTYCKEGKNDDIQIGDDEYIALCASCLNNKKKDSNDK